MTIKEILLSPILQWKAEQEYDLSFEKLKEASNILSIAYAKPNPSLKETEELYANVVDAYLLGNKKMKEIYDFEIYSRPISVLYGVIIASIIILMVLSI